MTLSTGSRLGPYEILAPLGSGGMGEVYRARDSKLDRDVAVKVLPASVANDADALARFEREAKAVAALSHPNILAIHDFGRQDGVAYAVTELLEGETLRARVSGGPISLKHAADYALQILKGLSAAHERGIVHRDLKPENVFVTKDGHVKILDFGLAKRIDQAAAGKETSAPTGSGHTEPGTVMGTMGYMSPEQVKGQPVDHRSDIFSFGTVLYELLSGKRAFKRDTSAETIVAILTQEPPELTSSGRNIPPTLDHIVQHCLEKDAGNRFQSAKDVAFALTEASGPSSAVAMSGPFPVAAAVAPSSGRKRILMAAAVAVVVAALAAGLLLLRRKGEATGGAAGVKRVAVLPFENLGSTEDDYFVDGMSDEIRGKLTSIPGIDVIARASSTPYKKSNKTPKQIAQELNANYLLTATVRWDASGGSRRVLVAPELMDVTKPDAPVSRWQDRFEGQATDVFQVQADIASRTAKALGVVLGSGEQKQLAERPTKSLPAYEAFLKGEQVRGAKSDPPTLRRAMAFYEQAVALDPSFAQAWATMAVSSALSYSNGPHSPADAERALNAAEKAMALAPNDPQSYRAVGFYKRMVQSDTRGGLDEFKKGLRIAPGNVNLMRNTAAAELELGDFEGALAHTREVLRLDPRSSANYQQLGSILLQLRRYPEARAAFHSALELSRGDLNQIESLVMSWLGEGNLSGARSEVAAASADVEPTELVAFLATYGDLVWILTDEQREVLRRLTPAAFDDNRANWATALAQAAWLRGDSTATRTYAEEARKAWEVIVKDQPDYADGHSYLGLSLAYLGRTDEAIREGRRAVELAPVSKQPVLGPGMLFLLARIYVVANQAEPAVATLEEILRVPFWISRAWLTIDPYFDPIRKDPRFQKLVVAKASG